MAIISDLSWDLVEEILSRVSITSNRAVRSTCKRWNAISKDQSFTKKHCGKASKEEFLVTITPDHSQRKVPLRLDLNNIKDMPSSINVIGKMISPFNIYQVYQFEGLLLLKTEANKSALLVCNPYLGQTRWIKRRNNFIAIDGYAIGYDNKNNPKILKFFYYDFTKNVEVYNFKSNSWRVLDVTPNCRILLEEAVSLKGNTYLIASCEKEESFIICFDFTTERFGPPLHLPVEVDNKINVTSSVRDEQLAVLLEMDKTHVMEIWITTKIEPNAASWSKFFKVNLVPLIGRSFLDKFRVDSFFIEKEKKVAVLQKNVFRTGTDHKLDEEETIVVGENGYSLMFFGQVFGQVFSYVPSSVQIQ